MWTCMTPTPSAATRIISGRATTSYPICCFDADRFQRVSGFEIEYFAHCEVLLFPLSGGVTSHFRVPQFPVAVLRVVAWLDDLLVSLSPDTFALQVKAALRKANAEYDQTRI